LFFINKSVGATTYLWDFGNGNVSIQTSSSYDYASGVYTVTLIGSNTSCVDTLKKVITVSSNSSLNNENTPNVFTPNGDRVNDVFDFKIMSNCEDFTFEIYDRWGLLILKDKKQSFWDGRTSSGEEVTDGTYFYIMNTESGRKLKGTVTLFR
jgi:gliding motility-associated-like protein